MDVRKHSTLGVGIIGAGMFGSQHARAVGRVSDLALVAASARTPERLTRFTEQFGGTGYRDYRDLIGDPAVDAVCIALPNNDHAVATILALEAGKAVLLEKPMASTVADCDAIIDAVRRTGSPFMVAHPYRYFQSYRHARAMIDAGEIGDPVLLTATMAKGWGFAQRERWHISDGGGMWITNGVHLIDRICWLADSLPASVAGDVGTRFHDQESEDFGVALLKLRSGAVGIARAVGYLDGARDDWTEVQGTRRSLRVSHVDGVDIGQGDRWERVFTPTDNAGDMLVAEWQAFLEHVRGGPSPVTGEYGRAMVAAASAASQSSGVRSTVAVDAGEVQHAVVG
jgi:predicted dehydrogenase